jgi:hypothetical protein
MSFRCETCNLSLNSSDQLVAHLNGYKHKKKLEISKFYCAQCHVEVSGKGNWDEHLAGWKHNRSHYICNICTQQIVGETNWQIHCQLHHKPEDDDFDDIEQLYFVPVKKVA